MKDLRYFKPERDGDLLLQDLVTDGQESVKGATR